MIQIKPELNYLASDDNGVGGEWDPRQVYEIIIVVHTGESECTYVIKKST